MTDAQDPAAYPPPPAAYPPPSGGSAPPPPEPTSSTATPGRTLGIVAFVLSFFVQLVALILGIVALVQSRKAGAKNGFAVAAIVISAILMVIGVIVAVLIFAVLWPTLSACAELGPGVWELADGTVLTCG